MWMGVADPYKLLIFAKIQVTPHSKTEEMARTIYGELLLVYRQANGYHAIDLE